MIACERVGFIGAGRIARVLLSGWRSAGRLPADGMVSDSSEAALETLVREFGFSPADARNAVASMLIGAVRVLFDSGLRPEAIRDLTPVRPLADIEASVIDAMRERLRTLMAGLRGESGE